MVRYFTRYHVASHILYKRGGGGVLKQVMHDVRTEMRITEQVQETKGSKVFWEETEREKKQMIN
jgi:hypothetical protein